MGHQLPEDESRTVRAEWTGPQESTLLNAKEEGSQWVGTCTQVLSHRKGLKRSQPLQIHLAQNFISDHDEIDHL